jgi:flagellar hook assembly protein FlgD
MMYQPGDENYNIEDLTSLSVSSFLQEDPSGLINVFPNPVSEQLSIDVSGKSGENVVSAAIYDLQGRLVSTLAQGKTFSDQTTLTWDSNDGLIKTSSGIYFLSVRLNGQLIEQKVVKQ